MRWLNLGVLAAVLLAAGFLRRSRDGARLLGRARTRTAKPGRGGRGDPETDPFEVLWLQMRLGALAEEVRALERSGDVYARGHHLKATQAAYDALLVEACRLAGISVGPAANASRTVPQDEEERFHEEVELASRGWSW